MEGLGVSLVNCSLCTKFPLIPPSSPASFFLETPTNYRCDVKSVCSSIELYKSSSMAYCSCS